MQASVCGGCPYHRYPYEAQVPILIDGVRENRTFTCDDDVWDVVELLIEETEQANADGANFGILTKKAVYTNVALSEGDAMMLDVSVKAVDNGSLELVVVDIT